MLSHEILHEIHFSDLYPKAFAAFHAKYQPAIGDGSLYVNFTNVVGNTVDKNFSPKPNHRDPSGLYTYPLEYVITNPSNIEYGQQAGFLRVIRSTASNKLVLNTMTPVQAVDLLTRMGVEDAAKKMAYVQRRYAHRYVSGNLAAKQFFGVLQTYLEVGQTKMTPNAMQTALLLKAGIDCLEDRSKTAADAIIYEDEPEQTVFLRRNAFRVVDVFRLRGEGAARLSRSDPTEQFKRLPGLIAQAIGDQIVGNNLTGEKQEAMSFYTLAKRKIVVTMKPQYRFLVGHRGSAEHSGDQINVVVMGPDFDAVKGQYGPDVTYTAMAADIAAKFAKRAPAQGDAYDVQAEMGPAIADTSALLSGIASKLKLPYTPPSNLQTAQRVFRTVREIEASTGQGYTAPAKATLGTNIAAIVTRLWPANRQPQGAQIAALWTAAMGRKQVNLQAARSLKLLADALGIKQTESEASNGESFAKTYGDLTVYRRADDLMVRIGTFEQTIAKINNRELAWERPNRAGDATYLIPHAADLCQYLNTQHFNTEGYATFLPENYGIACTDGHWTLFTDVADRVASVGGETIWKLPERGGSSYWGLMRSGGGEAPADGAAKTPKWRAFAIMFAVNAKNQITWIGGDFKTWLQRRKAGKPTHFMAHLPNSGVSEDPATTFAALADADFDLAKFATSHGLEPSAGLEGLDLFGLKANKDNGEIGKTVKEVLKPIGTFGGLNVFSYRADNDRRLYVVDEEDKLISLIATEPDMRDGMGNVKILAVGDLDNEQRATARALVAHLNLTIPAKFRPLLMAVKRPKGA